MSQVLLFLHPDRTLHREVTGILTCTEGQSYQQLEQAPSLS